MRLCYHLTGQSLDMLRGSDAPVALRELENGISTFWISGDLFYLFVILALVEDERIQAEEAAAAAAEAEANRPRPQWCRCVDCHREFYATQTLVRCRDCALYGWPEEPVKDEPDRGLGADIVYGDDQTLEQIGIVLGVTRNRIRQIEQAALHKIRSTARAYALAPFFEGETPSQSEPCVWDEVISSLPPHEPLSEQRETPRGWQQAVTKRLQAWHARVRAMGEQERWAAARRAEQEAKFDF